MEGSKEVNEVLVPYEGEDIVYKCTKELTLEEYDEEGNTIEGKTITISEGTAWFLSKDSYRAIDGDVRLETWKDGQHWWIEIEKDTLGNHFIRV